MNITEILDMLDWNQPAEVQQKGIQLAAETTDITHFIQPLTERHNKNVWDNCAIIVSGRTDEELLPYLPQLVEWTKDLNWPGSTCILNRLNNIGKIK